MYFQRNFTFLKIYIFAFDLKKKKNLEYRWEDFFYTYHSITVVFLI